MEIIWEDKDIVVINKPAGVVVNRVESAKGETVQDWAEKNLKLTGLDEEQMKARSGVAHRLDKETSGALLIAKNPAVLEHLMDQFKRRVIKKEYVALVHGKLEPEKGTIKLPVRRSLGDRKKQEVHFEGKQSETSWEVERYLSTRSGLVGYSLVRVKPRTGRMHQIRVHLAHLGHPIFADIKYLGKKKRGGDRKLLDHHFLHATRICFFDMAGNWQEAEVELPEENERVLINLTNSTN